MKATYNLTEAEIQEAIASYIEGRISAKIDRKSVYIRTVKGDRPFDGDTTTATAREQ